MTLMMPEDNKKTDRDFGLIEILSTPLKTLPIQDIQNIRKYLIDNVPCDDICSNFPKYPDLRYFFFLLGNVLTKSQLGDFYLELSSQVNGSGQDPSTWEFMKGIIGNSKKLFSFSSGVGRVWGYTRDKRELESVVNVLRQQFNFENICTGEEVIAIDI